MVAKRVSIDWGGEGLKLHSLTIFQFLQSSEKKYIKLLIIIYFALAEDNFYFKRLTLGMFKMNKCQIKPGKHVNIMRL